MEKATTKKKKPSQAQLANEVARVAKALEHQNHLGWRFLSGMVMGIGTALGASFVASLVLLIFSYFLESLGLSTFWEAVGSMKQ